MLITVRVFQVTSKDEDFLDLSIDVEQNTSITSCLRNFSNTETLCNDNKFKCDTCSTYQEAHVSLTLLQMVTPIFTSLFNFDGRIIKYRKSESYRLKSRL